MWITIHEGELWTSPVTENDADGEIRHTARTQWWHITEQRPADRCTGSLTLVPEPGARVRRQPVVREYGAYDLNDTEGLPVLAKEGGPYTPKFTKLKNYATNPVKVPAGKESNIFYLAKMKITAPPKDTARDCRFEYEQSGQAYTQTLDCELHLKVSD